MKSRTYGPWHFCSYEYHNILAYDLPKDVGVWSGDLRWRPCTGLYAVTVGHVYVRRTVAMYALLTTHTPFMRHHHPTLTLHPRPCSGHPQWNYCGGSQWRQQGHRLTPCLTRMASAAIIKAGSTLSFDSIPYRTERICLPILWPARDVSFQPSI